MKICGIKQTLPDVYEITPDAGSAFFLRAIYLRQVSAGRLAVAPDCCADAGGAAGVCTDDVAPDGDSDAGDDSDVGGDCDAGMPGVFTDEEAADILNAALVYSAECAAMTYLARAEQSRFGLTQKLLHKGIDKNAVKEALDYLESIHYLDDRRFAAAWLRSRAIDHAEGRIKLSSELASRGIKKGDADSVLDEFFENVDQEELCRRAYRKCVRQKKDAEKVAAALLRNGFSIGEIKKVIAENPSTYQ